MTLEMIQGGKHEGPKSLSSNYRMFICSEYESQDTDEKKNHRHSKSLHRRASAK